MQGKRFSLMIVAVMLAVAVATAQQVDDLTTFAGRTQDRLDIYGTGFPWSNPSSPEMKSRLAADPTFGRDEVGLAYEGSAILSGMNDLEIQGSFAYCATMQGLLILDVTDPTTPQPVSRLFFPEDRASDIVVVGTFAYVIGSVSGLNIIDVSDPLSPTLVSRFSRDYNFWRFTVSGEYAYITADDFLLIVNISDPNSPYLDASYRVPSYAQDVRVEGNLAYLIDGYNGLVILDISDHQHLELLGTYAAGYCNRLVVNAPYVYLAKCSGGIEIVNISDPTNPYVEGALGTPGSAYDLEVFGGHAFVADDNGFQVVDISNPATPLIVGGCFTVGNAYALALSGEYAYVTGYQWGLNIVNIQAPESPELVGTYGPGRPVAVAVSGRYAYVADNDSGFRVLDIADPSNPSPISSCCYAGSDLAVSGNHVYVAGYWTLQIIDVTNPHAPFMAGSYYNDSWMASGIAVIGTNVYLAVGNWQSRRGALLILDVANPQEPTLVGSISFPGFGTDVAVSGGYAYVTSYHYELNSSLKVIDIHNPQAPQLVASSWTPGTTRGVAIRGKFCFVANGIEGIRILDITNPQGPQIVCDYTDESIWYGGPQSLFVQGNYLYAACNWAGISVVNVAYPTTPYLAGNYLTPGWAISVAVAGDKVYVVDEIGFTVLSVAICGDIDGNAEVDISDVVAIVSYIFAGATPKNIRGSGDVDCNGAVDIADAVYLINYIFLGGGAPCEECK